MPKTIKHDRTHNDDDLIELMRAAEQALTLALADGRQKGFKPGNWLQHSFDDHLEHADAHVDKLMSRSDDLDAEQVRTELSHAICRLLMCWKRRDEIETAIV